MLELLVVVSSLIYAWSIGSNEETIASAVASRVVKIRTAVLLASVAAFLGVVFFSANVSQTLKEDVVVNFTLPKVFAVLVAAAAWMIFASWKGLPISTTTAMIGAMIGVSLVSGTRINNRTLAEIFVSWITSPIAGFIIAFVFYKAFAKVFFNLIKGFETREKLERAMSWLGLIAALGVVLVRAANDVPNAIFYFSGTPQATTMFVLGGLAATLGLVMLGKNVIRNLGTKLTILSPSAGFFTQVATLVTVALFTHAGIPISGSAVFVAALAGCGKARRRQVNFGFVKEILASWVITIPVSALMGGAVFWLENLLI